MLRLILHNFSFKHTNEKVKTHLYKGMILNHTTEYWTKNLNKQSQQYNTYTKQSQQIHWLNFKVSVSNL